CLLPYPAATPETFRNNDQLKTVTKEFGHLFKLVPDFLTKHYMAADSPQECLGITALDFNSFQPSAQLYVPGYMDWFFHRSDMLGTMKFHKRFLQYLQSGGVKSDRWLLKTPVHLMRLPEIFEVYPDARIIMTHRHPEEVVASTASLISSVRSLYSDTEDPMRTGREQAELWSLYFKKFLESRKSLKKEDQIIDLQFEDFVKDQIGTVRKIYDRFNWSLSDVALKNFSSFLEKNPKDKNGKHIYSLEIFGLNKDNINHQYRDYLAFLEELKNKS
ncbi:MAG: sulfotransferase, partial [Bacteroidales bacterium]|nr:sulfotransferase [Bacteroidales bacterium]